MLQIRPFTQLLCRLVAVAAAVWLPLSVQAEGLEPGVIAQVQQVAQAAATAAAPKALRVDVQVGQLAPQLRLAPCRQVQPYLPQGLQMWGRTRIGLKCVDGLAKWNVSVPVVVKVFGKAVVAQSPLVSGTVLTQDNLALAEIDIAGEQGAVFTEAADIIGRTLDRSLEAGQAVRTISLSKRKWFAAGDTVQVKVSGEGFAIDGEGQAMAAGLEGQPVKIRMENGRMITGRAVGERRVEVLL